MDTIKGVNYSNTRVTLDNRNFEDCTITSCEVVYSGGSFGWTNTKLTNCKITLRGSAALTVAFLKTFALVSTEGPQWKAVTFDLQPSSDDVIH